MITTESRAPAVISTTRASVHSRVASIRVAVGTLNTRNLLAVALGLAFVSRVVAIVAFGDLSSGANIWEYGEQAQCALHNGGDLCFYYGDVGGPSYSSAYMPPLLSYLWLGLFQLFGDGSIARGVWLAGNLAAALGCGVLIFHLALKVWPSRWSAFAAAAIFAVYPTFVFVTATYHQTNWAVLLLLSTMAVAVKLSRVKGPVRPWLLGALGGLLCALAALNRSEMLVVGPAVLALGAVWSRNWKAVLASGIAAASAMLVVMAPWVVRNYDDFDEFIPTAQSTGYNLWKGFNPYTNGSGNLSEAAGGLGRQKLEAIRASVTPGAGYETRLQTAYAHAFDDDLQAASAARLAELSVNKVALLWGFDWTDSEVTGGIDYRLPWLVTSLFAVLGVVSAVRWKRYVRAAPAAIYALAAVLLTAAYVSTAVHSRYRMHLEPIIFMMSGIGVQATWAWVRGAVFPPRPSVGDDVAASEARGHG